jgi:hypothetical protein
VDRRVRASAWGRMSRPAGSPARHRPRGVRAALCSGRMPEALALESEQCGGGQTVVARQGARGQIDDMGERDAAALNPSKTLDRHCGRVVGNCRRPRDRTA